MHATWYFSEAQYEPCIRSYHVALRRALPTHTGLFTTPTTDSFARRLLRYMARNISVFLERPGSLYLRVLKHGGTTSTQTPFYHLYISNGSRRYPFLLPNLIGAGGALFAIPLIVLGIPETQNLNAGRPCRPRRYGTSSTKS